MQVFDQIKEPFNSYAWDWDDKINVLATHGVSFTGEKDEAKWRREQVQGALFVPLVAAMCGIKRTLLSLQLDAQPLVTGRVVPGQRGPAFGVECHEVRLSQHGTPACESLLTVLHLCSAHGSSLSCPLVRLCLYVALTSQTSSICSLQTLEADCICPLCISMCSHLQRPKSALERGRRVPPGPAIRPT